MIGQSESDHAIVVGRRNAEGFTRDYAATLALINETSGDYDRMRVEHASLSEYSSELLRLVRAERCEFRRTIGALTNELASKTAAVGELQDLNGVLDERCQRFEGELTEIRRRYHHLETFCEEIILAIQPLLNLEDNPMLSRSTLEPILQSIETAD